MIVKSEMKGLGHAREKDMKINGSKICKKRRHQSCLRYENTKGRIVPEQKVTTKKDCTGTCRFNCGLNISDEERQRIHPNFWKLSDEQKSVFYGDTTKMMQKERSRG